MGIDWRRRRPRSLRGKVAACFALLSTLVALVLSATLGTLLAGQNRHEAGAALRALARVTARQLAAGLHERAREVQVIAESPTMWSEGLAAERVGQVFFRAQAVTPHIAWIGVADPHGRVVQATDGLLRDTDVGAQPWFAAAQQALHVGDVHPAVWLADALPRASDGGPPRLLDFAAPIRRGGHLLGIVAMHVHWDATPATIGALLPDDAAARGLDVFVFDRAGAPIHAPGAAAAAAGQRLPDVAHARIAATVVDWPDGASYLTAAARLPVLDAATDLGWTVVVREPAARALAPARRAALLALALGLAAALATSVVGWQLARTLTSPLDRLARAAQAVQARPQGARMETIDSSVELHRLSRALVGMTQRLQQANAELEQRVRERTEALELANAELAQAAHHDPLTGLLNRRGFDERIVLARAGARRRGAPLSVLVIDADHFKRINDRHGHDVGDDVLRALAETLRERLREADVLARLGGEEFVAVLVDTAGPGARQVAQSLVERIAARVFPVIGHVTVSCGVAEWQLDTESTRDVLARADAALYEAKQAGRNCHRFAADANASHPIPSERR